MIPWRKFQPGAKDGVAPPDVGCLWALPIGRRFRYELGGWQATTLGHVIVQASGSLILIPAGSWFALIEAPRNIATIDNTVDVETAPAAPPQLAP
jgi:hypothetical protein